MKVKKLVLVCSLLALSGLPVTAAQIQESNIKPAVYTQQNPAEYSKEYKKVTGDVRIMEALDKMIGTSGDYSRKAILGDNLTGKPAKVYFYNLGSLNSAYANYDALGMKKGGQLYIYVNQKHQNAPPEALSALLSHEALHQDEYNSINEETYAWTLEATVWHEQVMKNPSLRNISACSLVTRENIISKMLENADFSNKLIRNTVASNPGYAGLPARSPGFENVE